MRIRNRWIKIGLIAGCCILTGAGSVNASSDLDIKLEIGGHPVEMPIEWIDGSSYVPLRAIAEALGREVVWDKSTRTIKVLTEKQALDEMQQMLWDHREEVRQQQSLELMSSYVQEGAIHAKFRKLYRHREQLTESEIAALKEGLFEMAGKPFPIEVTTFVLGSTPPIVGEITQINAEQQQVLVENPYLQIGQPSWSDAYWVDMLADTELQRKSDGKPLTFEMLKLNQWVEVYNDGASSKHTLDRRWHSNSMCSTRTQIASLRRL